MKTSLLSLFLISISLLSFAEPLSVECPTNPSFENNSCDVCYTDSFDAVETSEGFRSDITQVKIPWKHQDGKLDEIIYDNEQKYPEIQSTLKVTTKPEIPEELWKNHESLIWTPFSDHKEVFIKAKEEIGLYALQDKATITVSGKKIDDTIMIVTPLIVRDFDAKTNEDSEPKTRNICVMGKFSLKKVTPAAPKTLDPVVETSLADALEEISKTDTLTDPVGAGAESVSSDTHIETPTLYAAGPESTTITAEQTQTETGPALWISLLLAFAFASAWNAWKRTTQ